MSGRSALYAIARAWGDVNAVRRGPRAVARRAGFRVYGRLTGRLWRLLLRQVSR